MRTITILLIVAALAGAFYLFAAQERSSMNCNFGQGEPEDDQEELRP